MHFSELLQMKCEFQVKFRKIPSSLRLKEFSLLLLFVCVINLGSFLDFANFFMEEMIKAYT